MSVPRCSPCGADKPDCLLCPNHPGIGTIIEIGDPTFRPEVSRLEATISDLTARCAAANVEGARLHSLLEGAVGMLREVEWLGGDPESFRGWCSACGHFCGCGGHAPDCRLVALLDRAGRALR